MKNTELEKEYELVTPLCEQFGRELTRQLEELLSEKSISLGFPLQFRVKQFGSVLQKIERASIELKHIQELNDLIGLRIILLFQRDVETVRALIKKNLKVFSEEDTQARLGAGEFGYSSVHFQIGLRPGWKKMPTFKKAGDLRAEIQVRTVAQHIWAAASHILQYKREAGVPPPIRRSIYRVSALLETVDLEFERVLEERKGYLAQPATNLAEEVLNVDLLAKILNELLPEKNKTDDEPYAELLQDLFAFLITTARQLRDLVTKHLHAALTAEASRVKEEQGKDKPLGTSKERVARGVFFAHVGLVRQMLSVRFGSKWIAHQNQKTSAQPEKIKSSTP